jgi:hypothetical protein
MAWEGGDVVPLSLLDKQTDLTGNQWAMRMVCSMPAAAAENGRNDLRCSRAQSFCMGSCRSCGLGDMEVV